MILGALVAVLIGVSAGAAIDNQYPVVGATITGEEQTCEKE
jgi:hypothetical protein